MRVLLLEVPRLLRELLEHAIDQDAGCELITVSEVTATAGDQMSPDAVVLGLTAAEDATLVPALFARWPRAQILTVMQRGGAVALHELSRHCRVLGEVSPSEMVRTLRDAAQRNRGGSRANGEDDDAWSG
jgi:DNA-binding NarL/FixJ family response regulator